MRFPSTYNPGWVIASWSPCLCECANMMWFVSAEAEASCSFDWYWRAAHCNPQTAARCRLLPHSPQLFPAPKLLKQWCSRTRGGPAHMEASHTHTHTPTPMRAYSPHLAAHCYWSPCSTSCLSWVISSLAQQRGACWPRCSWRPGCSFLHESTFSLSLTDTKCMKTDLTRCFHFLLCGIFCIICIWVFFLQYYIHLRKKKSSLLLFSLWSWDKTGNKSKEYNILFLLYRWTCCRVAPIIQ